MGNIFDKLNYPLHSNQKSANNAEKIVPTRGNDSWMFDEDERKQFENKELEKNGK